MDPSLLTAPRVFQITEHVLPCQHIREYPRATATSQDETLHLAVKQYRPRDNLDPRPGDISIIGAAANGFSKELYEPLWVELHRALEQAGVAIRGIWIADAANQGASFALNKEKIGDDPSWFDHSRDLIHLVNIFREQLPRPIIGLGHSMGATELVQVSLAHPRLFHSVILIEPILFSSFNLDDPSVKAAKFPPAVHAARRKETWPSRAVAAEEFQRSRFYKTWDPRVLDLHIQHGLCETTSETNEVTLATPKAQEVFNYLRPTFVPPPPPPPPPGSGPSESPQFADPSALRDMPHALAQQQSSRRSLFYRPETTITYTNLPHLRPATLFVFAAQSMFVSSASDRARLVDRTGSGVGGSGGAAASRVHTVVVEKTTHLAPMERPGSVARECAGFILSEATRWVRGEETLRGEWRGRTGHERRELTAEFVRLLAVAEEKSKL
ncbi:hypothetical protein ASPZODRAFT_127864 [Penicilliopsis zonata CBS 506.65]|uniref:AB hydrolase-1 domain-containing protein n=1 Tax=Penicilliopsis zonata CBS 506.65 TaxID=1073090 RepID=A0A1L9SX50_9EURO|nr:hypothetical protein ASPZODRAFT_127864 [Penicilliopsis zonata CBS 506.65]OJJ51739.1 hypothetical protein ASPZODRAFT_127864 [Penicilliopsis zonata CBS 506.65]